MDAVSKNLRDSHNLGAVQVVSRVWSGVAVHAIRMEVLPGRAWHQLDCDQPVLSIVVNELGGQCEARLALNVSQMLKRSLRKRPAGHVSLVPAGLTAWGYSDDIDQVDELRLILDIDRVKDVMGEEFTSAPLQEPRLVFNDDDLQALASVLFISEETNQRSSLFGDSVVTAMVARLSNLTARPNRTDRRLGLTARQLSEITDYVRENVGKPIRLSELAMFTGLSPSQFGRAFKISTGTTPHRWHLDARIEHAKRLLVDRRNRLVDVALETGFSEQSHFTRAFRGATGVSPSMWRRMMGRSEP